MAVSRKTHDERLKTQGLRNEHRVRALRQERVSSPKKRGKVTKQAGGRGVGTSGRATRPGNLDRSLSPGALGDDFWLVVDDGRRTKWEESATSRCASALVLGLSVGASE